MHTDGKMTITTATDAGNTTLFICNRKTNRHDEFLVFAFLHKDCEMSSMLCIYESLLICYQLAGPWQISAYEYRDWRLVVRAVLTNHVQVNVLSSYWPIGRHLAIVQLFISSFK